MPTLLNAATVTGAGAAMPRSPGLSSVQVSGLTSAGAGAVAVDIQVSNDATNWMTAAQVSLVLSDTETSDGANINAAWSFIRASVASISGTDAAVTVTL